MMLSLAYQETHDIDWFFLSNQRIIHCASNGQILPEGFDDSSYLDRCKELISILPYLYSEEQIEYNDTYIQSFALPAIQQTLAFLPPESLAEREEEVRIDESTLRQTYLSTFTDMARKGLWSYDHPNGINDGEYILVAKPKNLKVREDICPPDIHIIFKECSDAHFDNSMHSFKIEL